MLAEETTVSCELCQSTIEAFNSLAGIKGRMCRSCSNEQIDHMFEPIHKIDEGLYLGNQTAAKTEGLLKDLNIEAICVCGLQLTIQKYSEIKPQIRVYKIMDIPKANIGKYFEQNCLFIQQMRAMNKNVFVHCAAGVSRSASFVIAYLMKANKLSFEQAYLRVKQKRKCVKPNHGFVEQLKKFEETIK